MSQARKSTVVKLGEMKPGQFADCFAQLAEKKPGSTRDGKPFYSCRFRDARRTASVMIWADGGFYEACQTHWQVGQFYKIRGTFFAHDRFGPQLEPESIRPVQDRDRDDGFTELEFLVQSSQDADQMFAELEALAIAEITDVPLRNLIQKLLTDHSARLRLLPGSARHYYPFPGGWLEHTLNVARSCALLADRYSKQFPQMIPPLNRDLVVAGGNTTRYRPREGTRTSPPGYPARPDRRRTLRPSVPGLRYSPRPATWLS